MNVLLAGLPRIENRCEKNLNKSCPEGLGRQLPATGKYSPLPKIFPFYSKWTGFKTQANPHQIYSILNSYHV